MVDCIRIGVVGYNGRMGQEICSVIKNYNDKNNDNNIDKNIEIITKGGENGENKIELFNHSDIVIDFTNNQGLSECLDCVLKTEKPLVSGSTPMTQDLEKKLIEASKITKICWSANMSIGVAITKKISKLLGQYLPCNEYDCEILEKHHNQKKDAPSGTAIMLGKAVAEGREVVFEDAKDIERMQKSEKREIGKIGFSSIRGGSIFGEHEVMFIGKNDEITIKHIAFNRKIFAVGAVDCALKLFEKKEESGLFLPEDLL